MRVSRVSTTLEMDDVEGLLAEEDAVVLRPDCVSSCEELELAALLAGKSIRNGANIANSRKYEFLLWVSGKTDIRSALHWAAPRSPKDMLLVVLSGGKGIKRRLGAYGMPHGLCRKAEPLALERISLSRL